MHVVEHDIATNENSLSRNPQHRVFIGVALDVLENLYVGAVKCNRGAVEWLDRHNVSGCTRSQELFPFIEFLLIHLVDSGCHRRSRDDSHAWVCAPEHLQTEKMIGVLMSNVDKRERLVGFSDGL